MTGGARGIGRAVATALAQAGASVALLDSDAAAVAATSRAVAARAGQRTLAVPADVRVQAQMDRAVATTLAAFGQLDVFVANAGVWSHGLLTEVPEREWDRVFAVNLKGVLFGIQAVAPILKAQRRGKIVTIASAAGLNPSPAWSAYSISKSAVIALTQVAATELAPFQVQANAICPGAVDTDLTQRITDQTGERFPPRAAAGTGRRCRAGGRLPIRADPHKRDDPGQPGRHEHGIGQRGSSARSATRGA